jgi:hypothetical protein
VIHLLKLESEKTDLKNLVLKFSLKFNKMNMLHTKLLHYSLEAKNVHLCHSCTQVVMEEKECFISE